MLVSLSEAEVSPELVGKRKPVEKSGCRIRTSVFGTRFLQSIGHLHDRVRETWILIQGLSGFLLEEMFLWALVA